MCSAHAAWRALSLTCTLLMLVCALVGASSANAAGASKVGAAPGAISVPKPSNSGAIGTPFSSLKDTTTATPAPAATTTATETKTSEPTNSKSTVLIAIGAAALVLLTIGFVIARDARRVAPALEGEDEFAEARSAKDRAAMLQKRRAKAKAARQQRKRNAARAKR